MAGDIDGPTVLLGADASAVDTELSKVSGKFEQFANQADQSFSNIGKNFSLSNVSQQLDALSSKMRNIGSTLTLAALPFEAIGGMAVKAYSDFEQNIGKINTLLPDATKEQMQGISSELKEFSAQYGADINASTQAYYDALSAGVEQIDVMPFMEAAQKAGVAGMSDVSVAVDGLTSVMNAYQMETERATEVSDVMFKTVELGKIEFDQLANTIGKVTPTASSFGVSFQDVGAAISQITSLGVSPEETMTGLKNLIKDLGTEGSDLNKKFRELSGQGFSEFIASGGSLVDVVGMLRDYSEKTGTSFFNMTGSFEAANTLAMLGGDAFENYAGFLGKIEESAGATGKAYEAMAGTMKFSMDQLQAQTQTMMIDIGEALAPSVQEFTKWLSENSDEIRDFAVSIAETAVPALETLFDILTGLMDAFNGLPSEARGLLAAALGVGIGGAALGGPLLMGAGMALGPLSTMVSLLGSLVVPATVATEIGAIGTAAGVAAGSGGVGALATAIAALGGGPVVLALAGVTLGIAAWETDFMGVRTTVLGAAQDAFNGFQEAVNQGINVASSGGASVGKSFYEGIQSLTGFDLSGMIAPLDAVISQAQERARTGGAEAAQAYIREWNDAVASGELKVPNVPGSETPSRSITMENNPVDIDWNEINRQKGYLENIDAYTKNLTFVGVGNLTATDANALEYQQSIEKVNQSFSGLPGKIQEAVQQGAKDGITDASSQPQPDAVTGKTSGFDEFKAYKNSGLSDRDKYTDESLHKLYDSNTNLITKYEALAASKAEEAEATKSGTAAKKKLTTIEAALADNAIGLNDTFETAEGTYKKVIENGAYVAQEQGAAAELLRYNQAEIEKQSASDKAAQEKLTGAKKGYAEQIERAKLDYSQAIRSAKTPDAIESAKNSYQFKIEDIQLKAQQTGVDISDLNTTMDKTGSTVDILNTKYTTFNQDLLQQLRELEQEKAKKLTNAAEKGKIADTDSLDKRIKKLQDEISNNEAELKKSTASQRENVDIVKNSIQTQGDANKAVIEFGPAVDIGKESITTFSDSVGKIDLEGQFRQLFSDIDLREILNSGLNYQADMAVGRKASDADRTAVKEGYEDRFMATVASEVPKAADWAKTIGEPIESALAENGTVWAAVTKSYLENVRGVTGIPSALGWTQNDYMKGYLSGDDYAAISAMLKNIQPVVEGVYSGNVDVTGSGGYSDSMGKWWGTTFEAIQKADDATRDYSTSLSALSSAQYASDSRAVALTQAYNQAQDATASLDRYLADSSVSASEAADMQSQLSGINSLLAQSGVDATGGVSGLPPALQALASYASSAVSQINAAISSASAAVASAQQYLTSVQTAIQYKPDTNYKSSMADRYNITVTGNTFGSTTTAGKVVSDILNSSRASGF